MVRLIDAQVSYADHIAFSGFSLEVKRHESVSIIGRSGCGKTSLLYAIAGLIPLSKGTVALTEGSESCSIMFQQDRLLPWRKVIDNVLLGMKPGHETHAMELLGEMGLGHKAHDYPKQLSGGERQRVALARSLVRKPRLLLLDEPLASLDEQNRERMQEVIASVVEDHGITLILVTHNIQEAIFMGSRILLMTDEGITFERKNPYHRLPEFRTTDEFFALERELRSRLGGTA